MEDDSLGGLVERGARGDRAVVVAGFEGWVRDAMTRDDPSPSIVPYLKLVWLEWFAQSFEELKHPLFDAAEFRYRAIDASSLSHKVEVGKLLQHPAATPHLKQMIRLFLDTRAFLEERYP